MTGATEDSGLLKNVESIKLEETRYCSGPFVSSADVPTKRAVIATLRGPMKPINEFFNTIENKTAAFIKEQNKFLKIVAAVVFCVLYITYFVIAVKKDFDRAKNLVYITSFALVCILYWAFAKYCGLAVWKSCLKPCQLAILKKWTLFKWISICIFFVFVIFWIAFDARKDPDRLTSLLGIFVYIFIGFLGSKARDQIKWRPVLWGFCLQFIFGLLILRTNVGFQIFNWLGQRVSIFLSFSNNGSSFIFYDLKQFAFTVLPVIVFFSAITYALYYLGVIQVVIKKIAWILQITMGTSPAESVNAAGNIFIGQTEAPLLIRPFLEGMTASELHAVMTGGFATIAGSVLGAYISFGVSASHLLSASVMSAPAALAMSKLMYPETEESTVKTVDDINIEETDERNVFEALSVGAAMSIALVANIAVMLIAFLATLAFLNAVLHWLGAMVDLPELSFEFICSYIFMPLAYVMGVQWKDAFKIAELLGVKTFLNEFVAYERLAVLISNRVNNEGVFVSLRSEVIATYALCGFANFGSMGVQLGGLTALAPKLRPTLSKIVLRAMIAGTLACFMTACIAGLLYDESRYDTTTIPRSTNATTIPRLTNATIVNTPSTANIISTTISMAINSTIKGNMTKI